MCIAYSSISANKNIEEILYASFLLFSNQEKQFDLLIKNPE